MGYRYYLQFDDDALITSDITQNLVSGMLQGNYLMAVSPKKLKDVSIAALVHVISP
jgi:hypothetical protein